MPYYRQRTIPSQLAPASLRRGFGDTSTSGDFGATVVGPPLSLADPTALANANLNLQQQISDLTSGIQYRDTLLSQQSTTLQSWLSENQGALLIGAVAVFGIVLLTGGGRRR